MNQEQAFLSAKTVAQRMGLAEDPRPIAGSEVVFFRSGEAVLCVSSSPDGHKDAAKNILHNPELLCEIEEAGGFFVSRWQEKS